MCCNLLLLLECSITITITITISTSFVFIDKYQGRIEPPKAARGHATSRSPGIDGIVLSVTKNNISG